MSDIFLSYSSQDRPRAIAIARALEAQGWDVWWDRKILPGKVFDQMITEALETAKCVVVLWSKDSVGSHWVKEEAAEGLRRKVLIPALIDDISIPIPFKSIQAAQLINWQTDYADPNFLQLVESVSHTLGTQRQRRGETARERPKSAIVSPARGKRNKSSTKLWIGVGVAVIVIAGLMFEVSRSRRSGNKNSTGDTSAAQNPSRLKQITNSIGIEMVYIPSGTGTFAMGSSDADVALANENFHRTDDAFTRELPQHQVARCKSFYMGQTEVTQAQWQAVMGKNPSKQVQGADLPVENVSWNDSQEFIAKLNGKNDGYIYSLPTEAQWEYACRAGTTTSFAFGDSLSSAQANFNGNYPYGGAPTGDYREQIVPVTRFEPNAWGLYNMHGNVLEWCQDDWHENYNGAPAICEKPWEGGGDGRRILRGGSWINRAVSCRSASRFRDGPTLSGNGYGLRVIAISAQ